MARVLTDDQLTIVKTLDRPLFVAAGAGSGKSSTLAERVAWALDPRSGADGRPFVESLDQVLVITFTHLAADEIKEKIRERLREGGMEAQALAVDSAWISTIHGMCARILRRHAFDLGIDPGFSVLEESERPALVELATDEVLRTIQGDGSFSELLRAFPARSARGGDSLASVFGMVRAVRDAAGSALEGFRSLRFPGTVPDVRAALGALLRESERALVLGSEVGAFSSSRGMLEEEGLSENIGALEDCLVPTLTLDATALLELAGKIRRPGDAYRKKEMREVGASLKAAFAEARLSLVFAAASGLAEDVLRIARMVDARYLRLKEERGALDNDDLLSRTFEAFRAHPEIAAQYGSRFRLVMVDEFQDTNAQQVRIIELLSGPNACHLTTVGDAQQSIYRFRAADVQVFRDREGMCADASRVRLARNFRSHADVLAFVERALGGGPLPDFMRLDAWNGRPDRLGARELPRVDLELVTTAASGGAASEARAQALAAMVADRIRGRIERGERPEDVALLLGRMTNLDAYLSALRSRGVSCVVSGGSTFSRAPEVRLVAALLHVLANPRDTQVGLFPVLVGELFSLEADDLCLLGTKVQEVNGAYAKRGIDVGLLSFEMPGDVAPSRRLRAAREVLARAFGRMGSWRVSDVLAALVVESGWAARCEADGPEGEARLANALAAIRFAAQLAEGAGLGLSRVAVEFDRWLDETKRGPASLSGGSGGAVRVMTVHASKGLEFPLVAVAECWGSSRSRPVAGVTCENRAGEVYATLVPPTVQLKELGEGSLDVPDGGASTVEWAQHLVTAAAEGERAEEARLLYVALTRARESLIVGMAAQVSAKGEVKPRLAADVVGTLFEGALPSEGPSRLAYGGSESARVRHVVLKKSEYGSLTVAPEELATIFEGVAGEAGDTPFQLFDARPEAGLAEARRSADVLRPRAGVFSYTSAHALMSEAFQGSVPEEAPTPGGRMMAILDEGDIDAPIQPADADKATNLGSAFHELAQTMVETGRDHAPGRLEALSRHWGLSTRQRRRLGEAIARWEGSDLRREALAYRLVRPEVPFFLKVESAYGEYVEGAIDLLCVNGGSGQALVVDYKTGDVGLSADELRARHEMQANFYASVLMGQGYAPVSCAFVCVECDRGDGQPIVVRYDFDGDHLPRI